MRRATIERRLRAAVDKRLEPSETIVAWCRVWYSRPVRVQWFAARYRDFVVLTDRRLMMYSAGWLTRLPRRRVLADRLNEIAVETIEGRDRMFRLEHPNHPPMILQIDRDRAAAPIAEMLAARRARGAPLAAQPSP